MRLNNRGAVIGGLLALNLLLFGFLRWGPSSSSIDDASSSSSWRYDSRPQVDEFERKVDVEAGIVPVHQMNDILRSPDEGGQRQPVVSTKHPNNNSSRRRRWGEHTPSFEYEIFSSKERSYLRFNGVEIFDYSFPGSEKHRGINLAVLHERTGLPTLVKSFDTYIPGADDELVSTLENVHDGRIIVLATRDEASFHLRARARILIARLGSKQIGTLAWREMFCLIAQKNTPAPMKEIFSKRIDGQDWSSNAQLAGNFQGFLLSSCFSEMSAERRAFCEAYEGYRALCMCGSPFFESSEIVSDGFTQGGVLDPENEPLVGLSHVPVAVMASNRPHYLYRSLLSILSARGVHRSNVVVFMNGRFDEAVALCKVLGIPVHHTEPMSEAAGRVAQHYHDSLSMAFDLYPKADYLIVNEEDLDVSPDYFEYFEQLIPVLAADPSLYCISAWNDLGYSHTAQDASLLYRIETMPGLGWVLSRNLYKGQLEAAWPNKGEKYDWDMWMRTDTQIKGRECIIPDVSRTFHFGSSGIHMSSYFQDAYFNKHAFNKLPHVPFSELERMTKEGYDKSLEEALLGSTLVDHTLDVCDVKALVPRRSVSPHVVCIKMREARDWDTWMKLAKCWKVWDLDARGFHKSLWRLFLNRTPVFVIGSTSPFYHVCESGKVTPYFFPKEPKKENP